MIEKTQRLIACARGQAQADLVFLNAKIINVFSEEIEKGNVAVIDGRIAGIGDYREARESVEVGGRYLAPAFIDSHTHIESSRLNPAEYARIVVAHGTSGVIADPHEIVNVCGQSGLRFLLSAAAYLPLNLSFMVPSCVPSCPLESSGAEIGADEIVQLLGEESILGLGEMMNYPGVLSGDVSVLEKVSNAGDVPIDGHAPGLAGRDLNAYVAAGMASDHESTEQEEARDKLRRGMRVMIREGSTAKNLERLLPLVTDSTAGRFLWATDDCNCFDLVEKGHMDHVLRKAIGLGLDPVRAIRLASLNPAEHYRLRGQGGIAPGYRADLVILDDLEEVRVAAVYHGGELVAKDGASLFSVPEIDTSEVRNTVHLAPLSHDDLAIPTGRARRARIIEAIPEQIVTGRTVEEVRVQNGVAVSDPERDILKIVVVERHRKSGKIGKGFVRGFGLKEGALASTVAHDAHNVVAVGVDDRDVLKAIQVLAAEQGGLCVIRRGEPLAVVPLPLAGLLSEKPYGEVQEELRTLEAAAEEVGATAEAPFDLLSFLTLPVIPRLKITDQGVVDVELFRVVDLFEDEEP